MIPRSVLVRVAPKRSTVLSIVFSCLAIIGSACASGTDPGAASDEAAPRTPESVGISGAALHRLDRVLEAYVDAGKIPGYQLAITRHGQVVHESLYGQMDVEADRPLQADTIYRIYSMSKVITGVATMIAYERGSFLLNDPISKYFPTFNEMTVMEWDEKGETRVVPAEREITVLDLLRHTSGISYHFLAPPPLGQQYADASLTPGLRPLKVTTSLGEAGSDKEATLADLVDRLGELPLIAQPGTAWNYGINMDVLGRLIEVSSGQSFPDFLEEHLFGPLGMKDSGFYVPADRIARFPALYRPTVEGGMELIDTPETSSYLEVPAMPGGGGGMVATIADYLRFARMLTNGGELDGTRILSPRTVDFMMSNHLSPVDFGPRPLHFLAGDAYANGGLGLGFGLTGSVVTEPALTGLPVSKGTFGWGGAASTFFWVDPEKEISVVFMTQLLGSRAYPFRAHLMKGVNAALLD